jgi:hypothetical protein
MIAPSAWGFTRMNGNENDYLLPYFASGDFDDRLHEMLMQYIQLEGTSANDYRIREYTRTVRPVFTTIYPFINLTVVEDRAVPRTDMLRGVINNMSAAAVSRDYYYLYLQTGFREAMDAVMGYDDADLFRLFMQVSFNRWSESNHAGFIGMISPLFNPLLTQSQQMRGFEGNLEVFLLDSAKMINIDNPSAFVSAVLRTLFGLIVSDPVQFAKFIDSSFVNGHLMQAHYPEITLAWLMSQDVNYNPMAVYGSAPHTVRTVHIKCPVDVSVYKNGDGLAASFVNGIPQYHNTVGQLIYFVNEAGEKVIYLPADAEYSIEITATGNGVMSLSVGESNVMNGNVTRRINYYDIPVATGEAFTAAIPMLNIDELTAALPNGSSAVYTLRDSFSVMIMPDDEITGAAVTNQYFIVSVTADNDSGIATGGGIYLIGNFAQVKALPITGGSFIGWFTGSTLVSTDETYRFPVRNDVNLMARFTPVERHAMFMVAGPGGSIVNPDGFNSAGTQIAVSAQADDGYVFVDWISWGGGSFANANSAATTFTMPGNGVTVAARFATASGGGPIDPIPPESGFKLTTALTEEQIGNAALENLDIDVMFKYNGVESVPVLIGGQTVTVEFSAVNTSVRIKNVQFILALHDANGRLIDIRMQETLIAPNGGREAALQLQVPQNTNGLSLRVMAWDNYTSAAPHTCITATA